MGFLDDPYSMDTDAIRWRVRYEFGAGFGMLGHRMATLPDTDRLPGELPRLARGMRDARTRDEEVAAANAFLAASEEYID